MQLLTYLRTGTTRLAQVVDICHPNNNKSILFNINLFKLPQRYLSNTNKSNDEIGANTGLYKSTIVIEKTNDLKGGIPKATIDSTPKRTAALTGTGKAWSVQNAGEVNRASSSAATTQAVSPSTQDGKGNYETIAHATQGQINVADPFNTKKTTDKASDINEVPIQRESDLREEILRESLKYVDENGWTIEAIRAGISASNQSTTLEGLFSDGYDLIEFFQHDANSKMADYMKEQRQKGEIQAGRLLIEGLKYRIGLVIPYANTWGQALAQGALPQNAMRSWKNLFELSSEAWHGIGDTSTDVNWYSKRLLLSAIYKSAEIYMLQDQSQDKIDTLDFLQRRLNDFQTISSLRNTVSNSLSDTAQLANGLFSVIRNLTNRR